MIAAGTAGPPGGPARVGSPGGRFGPRSLALRRSLFAGGLVLPAALFCMALVGYPLARTLWMSVHNFNLTRPRRMHDFVGLAHYASLVADAQFWHAVLVMVIYAGAVTVLAYVIGLSSALLLDRRTRLARAARLLLTLPWAVPGVVAAFVFVWMFDASFGVVNFLLLRIGLLDASMPWLAYPSTAMTVIVLAAVWKTVPFNMLTHLAGLQAVPAELYEAAKVDGAGALQAFRHVTWPALGHVRVVAVVLTTLHAFREFAQIYVISGGGPARATETLSVQLYIEAFEFFRFGYAAAIGIVMLLISLLFTVVTVRVLRTDFQ